jgi:hypothetical protein
MTTAAEFDRLIAEYEAAEAGFVGQPDDLAAEDRQLSAFHALLEARPRDLATLGRQLRWLVAYAMDADLEPVLLHVAEQLEEMARG